MFKWLRVLVKKLYKSSAEKNSKTIAKERLYNVLTNERVKNSPRKFARTRN